jgi:hypothetical protein
MKKSNIFRELILDLYEVGETTTAIAYFTRLTQAKIDDEIDWKQYLFLTDNFCLHVKKEKIDAPYKVN